MQKGIYCCLVIRVIVMTSMMPPTKNICDKTIPSVMNSWGGFYGNRWLQQKRFNWKCLGFKSFLNTVWNKILFSFWQSAFIFCLLVSSYSDNKFLGSPTLLNFYPRKPQNSSSGVAHSPESLGLWFSNPSSRLNYSVPWVLLFATSSSAFMLKQHSGTSSNHIFQECLYKQHYVVWAFRACEQEGSQSFGSKVTFRSLPNNFLKLVIQCYQ